MKKSQKLLLIEWVHENLKGASIVEKTLFDLKKSKIEQIRSPFTIKVNNKTIKYYDGEQLLSEISCKEISQEEKIVLEKYMKFEKSEVINFIMEKETYSAEELKKAYEEISQLLVEAENKIRSAENIADKYGLDFSFSVSYGMGGHYEGKGYGAEDYNGDIQYRTEGEWISSSQNC